MAVVDDRLALEHLTVAQRNRLDRAEMLGALRRREREPVGLVAEPPACLRSMFVFDFLFEIPQLGAYAVRQINQLAVRDQVNLATTLGELSRGKRAWLVRTLEARPHLNRWQGRLAGRPQG